MNMGCYFPINDYALIGDCRSAALIARDGSLDWLCWPRFDSPAIFAALLDAERGGRFRIRPIGEFQVERRYRADTAILETTFRAPTGVCLLRDLMPVTSEEEKRRELLPEHEILREVVGLGGEVELEIVYQPRSEYGRRRPQLRARGALGFWCQMGDAALALQSTVPLRLSSDGRGAGGRLRVRQGEHASFSLSFSRDAPAVVPPLGAAARARVERSERWWQDWIDGCRYAGPYQAMVRRGALTLKLLTYAPSGAIVAAPTTSLPERLGGDKNYDYRYCWLRDAAFTLRALFSLGYRDEANAFFNWLLHSTRLTAPELQVVYDVHGEARLPERTLDHLEGYRGSRPVRIGNAAWKQAQLDVYGEVLDAASLYARHGGSFDHETQRLLAGMGEVVCRRWREPDQGIWEERGQPQHHTHSKVLAWVALDRLLDLQAAGHVQVNDGEAVRRERQAIRAIIEQRGYNEHRRSYVKTLDGTELDASLLALPLYGYTEASHPRIQSTCDRIIEELGQGSLIHRQVVMSEQESEGAFGICCFWAVECLARGGRVAAATRAFEDLLGYTNDIGLYAEEIDPATGEALGNFPQAFTHIGLINTALTLAECKEEKE